MHGKMENQLIIIENGKLSTVTLDDGIVWTVGRPSNENSPDIRFYSSTVSRRHGEFQNMDGVWFYLDHHGKNGTVYNGKHVECGRNGKIKPILLKDGDVLIFGGGSEAAINSKTVWTMFCTHGYEGNWKVIDTKDTSQLHLSDGRNHWVYANPEKGTVLEKEEGMVIYMGDVTYVTGNINVLL